MPNESVKALAKLFGAAARAPSAPGASVSPNYFQRQAQLSHFSRSVGRPGKTTGTYPAHWFKAGHPGNRIVVAAQHGIALPRPNTSPGPTQNFGRQTGGAVANTHNPNPGFKL